ncbi:single-stranded DNA-binding protein [Mucilaginibacter panaciglaebae]|uniref:Single-stranded DNA-binding protein n=1 Tax=Mucilaginibacter panaciglaebae TaxID=502331 RepID=A0ABP7X0Y1_9SPHI
MPGINKVILVGHLGKTPELRLIENETAVTSFPLATSETLIRNGIKEEVTEWHHIILWRGLAETAVRLLKKGQLVYIEGKLGTRKFTDSQNIGRHITEIIAEKFTLLGRKSDFAEIGSEQQVYEY